MSRLRPRRERVEPPEELLRLRADEWSGDPLPLSATEAWLLRCTGRELTPDECRVRRWADARLSWHRRHGWPGGLVALVLGVAEERRRFLGTAGPLRTDLGEPSDDEDETR